MRNPWVRSLALALILVLIANPVPAAAADVDDWWVRLSAKPFSNPVGLQIAPNWPDDQRILILDYTGRQNQPTWSLDGGRTWGPKLTNWNGYGIVIAPPYAGTTVIFGHDISGLHRTLDLGQTWGRVASGRVDEPIFSPSFSEDGVAIAPGEPFRLSRDGGATWDEIQPLPGARTARVAFSPDFAARHTLFAATSAGVSISDDAGHTWTAVTAGLEVDGVPHHDVRQIVPSPTIAEDATLLAFAQAPRDPATASAAGAPPPPRALFRSIDRGLTWSPVYVLPPDAPTPEELTLSPTFASDRTALAGASGSSPKFPPCRILRTADGGDTWQSIDSAFRDCADLRLLRSGASLVAAHRHSYSPDGGANWQPLVDPNGLPAKLIVASPRFAEDQVLFMIGDGTGGHLWAFGPNAPALFAGKTCQDHPTGGFGRVFEAEPVVRARLGCPIGPETPLRLWEQPTDTGRRIWRESSTLFELTDSPSGGWGTWRSSEAPPPDNAQAIQGVSQSFELGQMLFLNRPDGRRTVLVLGQGRHWREWPDEP